MMNYCEVHKWNRNLGLMKPFIKTNYSTLSETETNLVREGITYEYDTNFNTWNELKSLFISYESE